jgi:hypothetical protein
VRAAVGLLIAGCGWILAHDHPAPSTVTRDCTGIGEERCGPSCCDGWHDYRCNLISHRCEFRPDPVEAVAPDSGRGYKGP